MDIVSTLYKAIIPLLTYVANPRYGETGVTGRRLAVTKKPPERGLLVALRRYFFMFFLQSSGSSRRIAPFLYRERQMSVL